MVRAKLVPHGSGHRDSTAHQAAGGHSGGADADAARCERRRVADDRVLVQRDVRQVAHALHLAPRHALRRRPQPPRPNLRDVLRTFAQAERTAGVPQHLTPNPRGQTSETCYEHLRWQAERTAGVPQHLTMQGGECSSGGSERRAAPDAHLAPIVPKLPAYLRRRRSRLYWCRRFSCAVNCFQRSSHRMSISQHRVSAGLHAFKESKC